jgi:outer membrane protein
MQPQLDSAVGELKPYKNDIAKKLLMPLLIGIYSAHCPAANSADLRGPLSSQQPVSTSSQNLQPITVQSQADDVSRSMLKADARYDVLNEPTPPTSAVNLVQAIAYAQDNYPGILKSQAQMNAARLNVKLQKLNEYLPDSLFQYQQFMASHNQLTASFYGSPVFPGISGPGFNSTNMTPIFSTLGGYSLDWAPLDFGLHKARINVSKIQSGQSVQIYEATKLDVATAVANAYLDAVVALEQIKAAQENVKSFQKFSDVVQAQISGSLKPAADQSLALAQLANAQNDMIRAQLAYDVAIARLTTAMGIGGRAVEIVPAGLSTVEEKKNLQPTTPVFKDVPVVKVAHYALLGAIGQKRILDKEYAPVFHFVSGVNVRGSGLNRTTGLPDSGQSADGLVPTTPNYQAAVIVNWNFLDIFRLKAEKKVQMQKIYEKQNDLYLVLQNLRGQDVEAKARVKAAIALAENMPIQVESAQVAVRLAEARYSTGLGSVAQVAESAQLLANSRVKEASARINVWRALLEIAYVHGDLQPFLNEARVVQERR